MAWSSAGSGLAPPRPAPGHTPPARPASTTRSPFPTAPHPPRADTPAEVAPRDVMPRKGQRGPPRLQLAIRARLMQESALQAEGPLEEVQRGRHIGDVDDGVGEAHAHGGSRPADPACVKVT
ncbi:hypothetical protein Ddc_19870 [Ditylenchus destructor]|nr:hypothetical protein Ddc_19870 [Ditylenchus destructor]